MRYYQYYSSRHGLRSHWLERLKYYAPWLALAALALVLYLFLYNMIMLLWDLSGLIIKLIPGGS